MIHQCYFDDSQRGRLFASPLYRGFGLYSSVNPDIARNCPELSDPNAQAALSEYGAMLHLWRNPDLDPDPWIGFTSYRQTDKFPIVFGDRHAIAACLEEFDVLGWAAYEFFDAVSGRPLSMAEQGEWEHPGITMCIWRLLMAWNEPLPRDYMTGSCGGVYCNYWLMAREHFHEYMNWSYPLVRHCLDHPDDFIRSHPRAPAYLVERLFICWCELSRKKVLNVAPPVRVRYRNSLFVERTSPAARGTQEPSSPLSSWNMSLFELCHRHHAIPRGIVHVGAHYAQEREVYRALGVGPVLWIEADPENMPRLTTNISTFPGSRAIRACLADTDGQVVPFYRTNNHGESSSILPLGTHRDRFPDIHVTEETTLRTTRFATLVTAEAIPTDQYDWLVMDVQGAELLALVGFGDHLGRFNGVYLEVNLEHLYQGCALLSDIDAFLGRRGFVRRETLITDKNYGHALYLREGVYEPPPEDLARRKEHAVRRLLDRRAYVCRRGEQGWQPFEILTGGHISGVRNPEEQGWVVRAAGHDIVLELVGPHGRAACLRYLNDFLWLGGSLLRPDTPVALLPAALLTEKRAPLGYPERTNLPIDLVDLLRERLGLRCFVETGTCEGVTARAMAERFERVITVELDPASHRRSASRLAAQPNVRCLLGDSVQQLAPILREIDQRAVVWLDAHWSGGHTAKGDVECPVLAELAAIYAHRPDHVVLIDDFRLFLSPPPPPHDPREWPSFAVISEFLARQKPAPFLHVVGDVLVVGPWDILPVLDAYRRAVGR
jgi:FkbM family methyltransferase